MRFIVYGAGAVGGVIGARLHQHGHDVVLIARGAHLEAIVSRGLRLQSPTEDVVLRIPTVGAPAQIGFGPGDVVLLCTKSQDTIGAALALSACAPPELRIVSAQNGVANELTLLRWFADVYGICVMAPTSHVEPGVVEANNAPVSGILDIGRSPDGVDDTAREIADALSSSTFDSVARPDIMRWKYTKLLMNVGNAVDATCIANEAAARLVHLARDEARACFDAAGIDRASPEEDRERRGDRVPVGSPAHTQRGGGSTWQSFARGAREVEVDYLNGEIVLLGRRFGVATPVNERVRVLANHMAREGAPARSTDASQLLRELAL
jgi:2-dehydropantoate 2-reductase